MNRIDTAARTVDIAGRGSRSAAWDWSCSASSPATTRVFAKNELMNALWGYSAVARTCTLDSHVRRVHRKLNGDGATPYVANRWGHGYPLVDTP